MNYIAALDYALEFLAKRVNTDYQTLRMWSFMGVVGQAGTPVSEITVRAVLNKLVRDGLATCQYPEDPDPASILRYAKYDITVEGILFHQKGGYAVKFQREARTALIQNLTIWVVALGTASSGIYGIVEIFRNHLPNCTTLWSLIASYLFGAGTVGLILLIRFQMRRGARLMLDILPDAPARSRI